MSKEKKKGGILTIVEVVKNTKRNSYKFVKRTQKVSGQGLQQAQAEQAPSFTYCEAAG
ncbi:hypothetical protein [Paenibacillus sp. FSL W7-1287]|uniref:hypothetical protein n=1 Tax=Paenibacillus sp. FSL W7-1287 TaxID=2954538 RepID=UPI0030F5717A